MLGLVRRAWWVTFSKKQSQAGNDHESSWAEEGTLGRPSKPAVPTLPLPIWKPFCTWRELLKGLGVGSIRLSP